MLILLYLSNTVNAVLAFNEVFSQSGITTFSEVKILNASSKTAQKVPIKKKNGSSILKCSFLLILKL